jgi:hypothetical protein
MHNLAEDDEKLHISYQLIQNKYRRSHGVVRFLAMKFWARTILRRNSRHDGTVASFRGRTQLEWLFGG